MSEQEIGNLYGLIEGLDKRIEGSFSYIGAHIRQGTRWRIVIIGVIFTVFTQVIGFVYLYGGQTEALNTIKTEIVGMKKKMEIFNTYVIQEKAKLQAYHADKKRNHKHTRK